MSLEEVVKKLQEEISKFGNVSPDEEMKSALIDLIREEPEIIARYCRELGVEPETIIDALFDGLGLSPEERRSIVRDLAEIVKRRL